MHQFLLISSDFRKDKTTAAKKKSCGARSTGLPDFFSCGAKKRGNEYPATNSWRRRCGRLPIGEQVGEAEATWQGINRCL
jgi:hypothetical protein